MSIASSSLTLTQVIDGLKAISRIQPMQDRMNTTFERTQYHVMNVLAKEGRRTVKGGDTIKDTIELSADGTVNRLRSPYEELPASMATNAFDISANWALYHDAYFVNKQTIAAAENGDYSKKLLNERNQQQLRIAKKFASTMENDVLKQGPSSSNTQQVHSMYYWFPKALAGVTTDGYVGTTAEFADGSSTTTIGGIDSTASNTNGLWRSPVTLYDDFNDAFIDKANTMFHTLDFEAPDNAEDLIQTRASNFKIVAGQDTVINLERIARANGDAFGNNLGMMKGQLMFRGIPIRKAPILDEDTDVPLFWYNLEHFEVISRDGWWFLEDEPMRDPKRRLCVIQDIYCNWQLWCNNRRQGGGVMHKPRAAS